LDCRTEAKVEFRRGPSGRVKGAEAAKLRQEHPGCLAEATERLQDKGDEGRVLLTSHGGVAVGFGGGVGLRSTEGTLRSRATVRRGGGVGYANVDGKGFCTKHHAKVATAIVGPVILDGLNPRSTPGFGNKVSEDVDDVIVAQGGEIPCLVDETVPGVKAEIDPTVAVWRHGGREGEVKAELGGGSMSLRVHWGGRKRVAYPGAGQRGTTSKEAGAVGGREEEEGIVVLGVLSRPSEGSLEFVSKAGVGEVEIEAFGGGSEHGRKVAVGNVGKQAGLDVGECAGDGSRESWRKAIRE
jgi:hypothetical protein